MRRRRRMSVRSEIETISTALVSIAGALKRLLPAIERQEPAPAGAAKRQPIKLRLSPARRAALKLQGRYIGHIRSLPARQKARVRALRETKGIRAAIGLARKLSQR